jgi:hypothetical protein
MADERIQVQCYPNATGDPIPKAVVQGAHRRDVVEVLERWTEELRDPDFSRRRWFRVRFLDGTSATIYQDVSLDAWFLRRRTLATPEITSPGGK